MVTSLNRRSFVIGTAMASGAVASPVVLRRAWAAPAALTVTNAGGATTAVYQAFLRVLGYFKEFDVEPRLENVPDSSKIVAAIIGGSSDGCMLAGLEPVLPAIDRGAKLKIIAGANLLASYALMSGNPAVRKLQDLEGRIVGTGSPGALTFELTTLLLKKHGVDPKKVKMVNIGSTADIFRSVVGKTVDAGLGTVAVYLQREKYGVHAVEGGLVFDELPQYTGQGSFTSERAIQSNRPALVRMLAAHVKSYRFLQTPASKDVYLKAFKTVFPNGNETEALGEWEYIQWKKPYATDLMVSKERIDFLQDLNLEKGSQKRRMNYDEIADMSLAQEALALLK